MAIRMKTITPMHINDILTTTSDEHGDSMSCNDRDNFDNQVIRGAHREQYSSA